MRGDLAGSAANRRDDLCGPAVELRTQALGQVVIDRLTDERVEELDRLPGGEDLRLAERVAQR